MTRSAPQMSSIGKREFMAALTVDSSVGDQPSTGPSAVAAQSLLIAVAGAVLAASTRNLDLSVIAGVTLAVKALVVAEARIV